MNRAFPTERISKLTLGTAQLGMAYGIANRGGKPGASEAEAILDAAWAGGITCFDTAPSYGDAEVRIGGWRARTGHDPILISKLPALADGLDETQAAEAVTCAFEDSCGALEVERLDGYLAHAPGDLFRPGVAAALAALVDDRRLGAFGLSAYEPEEIDRALAVPGLALVQVPVNALDFRAIDSGLLEKCRSRGVTVFARSIFLQGLFFLDPDELPAHLLAARPAIAALRQLAAAEGLSLADLALSAVRNVPGIVSQVVGVDSPGQLAANLRAAAGPRLNSDVMARLRVLARSLPRDVVDPRKWPAHRRA